MKIGGICQSLTMLMLYVVVVANETIDTKSNIAFYACRSYNRFAEVTRASFFWWWSDMEIVSILSKCFNGFLLTNMWTGSFWFLARMFAIVDSQLISEFRSAHIRSAWAMGLPSFLNNATVVVIVLWYCTWTCNGDMPFLLNIVVLYSMAPNTIDVTVEILFSNGCYTHPLLLLRPSKSSPKVCEMRSLHDFQWARSGKPMDKLSEYNEITIILPRLESFSSVKSGELRIRFVFFIWPLHSQALLVNRAHLSIAWDT